MTSGATSPNAGSSSSNPAVHTRALSKKFGSKLAVDSLDLEIQRGEIYGLIGPNGAGKSTTMRMLIDVLRPSSGSIEVLGQNPQTSGAALRRKIGYLPGEFVTVASLTGAQMLHHFNRLNPPPNPQRLTELAHRIGADLTRPMGKLSKGNKQKIGLLQAFVHDPELLILDEPTSGLDPIVQQTFLELVREASQRGQTVFLSSHILSEIQHVAQRVGVMRNGQLITTSTVQAIRDDAGQRLRAVIEPETPWAGTLDPQNFQQELARQLPASELSIQHNNQQLVLTGTLHDSAAALISFLSTTRVHELSLEKPDLEESVLQLYGGTETGAEADPHPARPHRPAK